MGRHQVISVVVERTHVVGGRHRQRVGELDGHGDQPSKGPPTRDRPAWPGRYSKQTLTTSSVPRSGVHYRALATVPTSLSLLTDNVPF